ncbi:MAG TPA: hypothetical protein VHL11_05745, partial [Phototrophicaceae bacterium]|nr:hypothetical protein [Phototrophicaceae bacterium]
KISNLSRTIDGDVQIELSFTNKKQQLFDRNIELRITGSEEDQVSHLLDRITNQILIFKLWYSFILPVHGILLLWFLFYLASLHISLKYMHIFKSGLMLSDRFFMIMSFPLLYTFHQLFTYLKNLMFPAGNFAFGGGLKKYQRIGFARSAVLLCSVILPVLIMAVGKLLFE